jgi:hypothetical protein
MTQTTSPLRALLNVEASASVPKLSNAQMLDAAENSAIRRYLAVATRQPQGSMAEKIRARTVSSHVVMLSHPSEVADVIYPGRKLAGDFTRG